jgi:hypothetical protein
MSICCTTIYIWIPWPVPNTSSIQLHTLPWNSPHKNGVSRELVRLSRSGHQMLCPILAIIKKLWHLWLHRVPPTTPLYHYFAPQSKAITTTELTYQLWLTCSTIGQTVGINPQDISICSLGSSGAMALLCASVDPDKIRLLGQWKSDEMLWYLHV